MGGRGERNQLLICFAGDFFANVQISDPLAIGHASSSNVRHFPQALNIAESAQHQIDTLVNRLHSRLAKGITTDRIPHGPEGTIHQRLEGTPDAEMAENSKDGDVLYLEDIRTTHY